MPHGTVKFFNAAKGFGFITADEGGKDVFVPGASVTSADLSGLKPGQRVAFETIPDGKGPKAVSLTLIATPSIAAPVPAASPTSVREPTAAREPTFSRENVRTDAKPDATMRLTFYHDPDSERSHLVLDALEDAGHEMRIIDYIATPPAKEELKTLSILLRDSDQSLVRKYDPLFRELQLDDRFISDNEFWDAIVEHPVLINGPVITAAGRAGVCHTDIAAKAFVAGLTSNRVPAPPPQKRISDRLLHLLTNGTSPPPAANDVPAAKELAAKIPVKKDNAEKASVQKDNEIEIVEIAEKPVAKAAPVPAKKAAAPEPKAKTKTKAVVKAKAAPKPAAKLVKPATKPTGKAGSRK